MTSTNRFLNRMLLILVALLAFAVAAGVAWPTLTQTPLPFDIPDDANTQALAIVVAAASLVIVFTIGWIATRGRGRSRLAVDAGGVRIDTAAVEDLVRTELTASPDVAGVRVQAYRVRREQTLLVTVQTRRHPDLVALTAVVRAAIASVDERLGTSVPTAVHITTGLRTTFGGTRAAH